MNTYLIECKCGISIAVTERQAGSSVSCGCGLSASIPALSQLRTNRSVQLSEVESLNATPVLRSSNDSGLMCGAIGILVSVVTLAVIFSITDQKSKPDPANMFVPIVNGIISLYEIAAFAIGSLISGFLSIIGLTISFSRGVEAVDIAINLAGPAILVAYVLMSLVSA